MAKTFFEREITDLTKDKAKVSKARQVQVKCWCATAYHHKFDNDEEVKAYLDKVIELSTYFVAGLETCPTTGKKHFQMYFELDKRMRLDQLKKLEPTVHYEPAKGTADENFVYCTKEDPNFIEVGTRPVDNGARERNRWALARQYASEGNLGLVDDQIYISYYKSLQQISRDSRKPNLEITHTCGVWLYGVPHSGKSFMARHKFGDSVFIKLPNAQWWDGYNFEEVVVIEDVEPSMFVNNVIQQVKCWTDIYPFPVEVKGGSMFIRPKLIVFTSNHAFEECFGSLGEESYKAMVRRFQIFEFPKVYEHGEDVFYQEHNPVLVAHPGTVPTFNLPIGLVPSSVQNMKEVLPMTPDPRRATPAPFKDKAGNKPLVKIPLTRSTNIGAPKKAEKPGSQTLSLEEESEDDDVDSDSQLQLRMAVEDAKRKFAKGPNGKKKKVHYESQEEE